MRHSFIPEIVLDEASSWPFYEQVHAQMVSAIRQAKVPNGSRLPSSRELALMLKVSRNTVVRAYEELLEDGLIETRRGSGVRVTYAAAHHIPNFSNLRRTAQAAHYPAHTVLFTDVDGTPLYLNAMR